MHEVALLFKYLDAESLCTERKKKSALSNLLQKFMHLPLEGTNKAAFWESSFKNDKIPYLEQWLN